MIKGFKKSILSVSVLMFVGLAVVSLVSPRPAFAAPCDSKDAILSASNIGLPTWGCGTNTSIIQTITQLAFGSLATISLLFIVIGGLRYALSGGDSNAIASAKKTILYAVIGLVLGISVFVIISFIFGALD